jgi:hypothetical protein
METMRVEPLANGYKSITSADVVSMVFCLSQGQVHSQASGNTLVLKNAGISTWSVRTETLAERTLRVQLIAE